MASLVVFLTFIGWLDGLGWLAGLKTNITEEVLALYMPHALRSKCAKAQKAKHAVREDKTESWKD